MSSYFPFTNAKSQKKHCMRFADDIALLAD